MDELEYRSLLIEMVRTSDYEKKEDLLEILKMCTIRFEKTGDFTRSKWNHYKEYIHVCIVPDKISELEEHFEYLEEVISDIYPPNDEYEFWGAKIKPGIISGIEDVSQEILFKEIRNRIVDEIRDAKYMIWISVAWFTDPVLYEELLKKKQQGLVIEIALNDCQKNRDAEF